jgi:prepilin-type N-terminal cleavage/methylation domain-containing protein
MHTSLSLRAHLRNSSRIQAFSLIELLAVMAIISLMLVASRPALNSLAGAGGFSDSMNQIAQAFDLARQRAIARNTYVWVAMSTGKDATNTPYIDLCVVESKTGTDNLNWSKSASLPTDPDLTLVQRTQRISQVNLVGAGEISSSDIPSLPSLSGLNATDMASSGVSFQVDGTQWSGSNFDHVVQFTPSGEARVSKGLVGCIELGLKQFPKKTPAVIRVNGITGLATVYH